jgi:galactitol-specific phosphotransferase system IIB component
VWVKLIAWLVLQARLAVTAVSLAACVGAAIDASALIKKTIQAIAASSGHSHQMPSAAAAENSDTNDRFSSS